MKSYDPGGIGVFKEKERQAPYVAPEGDSHWSENVFTSCTDNGDQEDVTNEDVTKDMHKDFFCENCPKQFLTKTLLRLHKKTHVV